MGVRRYANELIGQTVVGILTIMVIFVTMVYGPIAAMLVEMFPTRIRYTSMSLPYHIGNGWFGGLLPATAIAIVAQQAFGYDLSQIWAHFLELPQGQRLAAAVIALLALVLIGLLVLSLLSRWCRPRMLLTRQCTDH